MKRERMQIPDARIYKNEIEFLHQRPSNGTHSIKMGAQWLDVIYVERKSDVTLVAFHGAASRNIRKLPYFTGRDTAEALGWNLITMSDPSLQLGDIDLAWFLGGRAIGPLPARLSPVIKHLLGHRAPVLIGASGGGYAAMLYGLHFPDSTVVAMNPRINMGARPKPAVDNYLKVCHRTKKSISLNAIRRKYVVENLGKLFEDGLSFDLHLIQNLGDTVYLNSQARPFADKYEHDPRFNFVTEYFGQGHVGVPPEFLHSYLLSLESCLPCK